MDVDIDVHPSFDHVKFFEACVRASVVNGEKLQPHPCGGYFQEIAVDPVTGLAAIPYAEAESLGYFKIDFLHVNFYKLFSSKSEMRELLKQTPDWSLLGSPAVVAQLFQLSKHRDILTQVKPTSVIELADVLALIRPSKRSLLGMYLRDRNKTRQLLYTFDDDAYGFKKSHAIAYALIVILQLQLISSGISISD